MLGEEAARATLVTGVRAMQCGSTSGLKGRQMFSMAPNIPRSPLLMAGGAPFQGGLDRAVWDAHVSKESLSPDVSRRDGKSFGCLYSHLGSV